MGEEYDRNLRILKAVEEVNEEQKKVLVRKLVTHFGGKVSGKVVALWGLAFKPQTDDVREAPSVAIIKELLAHGVKVHAHDPIAIPAVKKQFAGTVEFFENGYEALKGAEAWMVVTEWNEFRRPDFGRIAKLMKQPVLFDGRNIYDAKEMKERGFVYYGIGR